MTEFGGAPDVERMHHLGVYWSYFVSWGGTNKMGWDYPEHDRLYDQWTRTLDASEGDRILVRIGVIEMEQLPFIPTYFDPAVAAHAAALVGPSIGFGTAWHNVQQWHWK